MAEGAQQDGAANWQKLGEDYQQEQRLDESFDNWTGDELRECDDLVYKLSVSNTTEQPILYKVSFKAPANGEPVNLDWPINGIKGAMGPGENATVALLAKIFPGEALSSSQFELEKLRVELTWKADVEKIAKMADSKPSVNNNNNNWSSGAAAGGVSDSGGSANAAAATNTQGQGNNNWQGYSEWDEMAASEVAGEKNCIACTFLMPVSASVCSVCQTAFQ